MPLRFPHQTNIFEKTKDMIAFALFWEVRTAKTLPTLDTAHYWYQQSRIDTVFVFTTNGNHIKWAEDHIPAHAEEMGYKDKNKVFTWISDKSRSQKYEQAMTEAQFHDGLLWICVNFEALPLDRLEAWLEKILKQRKGVFLIIDESHRLKDPSAQSTRAALRMAQHTKARRLLTGSPAPKNPFDLWSQFQLLDDKIFNERFTSFKQHFGIWKRMRFGSARAFDALDVEQGDRGFKNLDLLYKTIEPFTSRLLRRDVFKDLPENDFRVRRFDISPKQRKAFNDLRDEMATTLDSGEVITVSHAIVWIMRGQQISRGFVGQTGEEAIDLGGPYPALDVLDDEMDKLLFDFLLNRKIIIWCRFTADVDMVLKHLAKAGYGEFVRYDGQVNTQQREINIERLQNDPKVRGLVGNPACSTEGKDMTAAYAMIYYSYSYKLIEREQSIGRNHGVNQKERSLPVIELVANNTFDDEIRENLEGKKDLASIITGDKMRAMLKNLKEISYEPQD